MELLKESLPVCPRNQYCAHWARIYMKYCLCGVRDGVSLTLGLVSVISWGVAEVPQIITNCREKSTEGLSIAFLMTWVIGDLFNLFGCKLEPATLPTQYYMALLYTVTTVVLTAQTVYYGHIYHRLKAHRVGLWHKVPILDEAETGIKDKQKDRKAVEKVYNSNGNQLIGYSVVEKGLAKPSSPMPVSTTNSSHVSNEKDLYYMSARSLSKSHTPTAGSYMARAHGGGSRPPAHNADQHSIEEPLLARTINMHSAPPSNTKSLLCVVSAATVFFGSFNLDISANDRFTSLLGKPHRGIVIQMGRKLLQSNGEPLAMQDGSGGSGIGTILGWAMAAIYMGGRLPQICLNIRRGNVEGLNPLMFIFALVGNLTYVASILVSSLAWSKIKSNLPWLVDAGGCVVLDSLILVQFIYFRRQKSRASKSNHDHFVAS